MHSLKCLVAAAAALLLGACATATVIPMGNARPPIDPSQVRLYAQPPAHYEVLGIITGNSQLEGTGQSGVNDVIKKVREEAAKLGANGVLIAGTGQQYSGSIGGSNYLGWGMFASSSSANYSQLVDAKAIYVPDAGQTGGYADAGGQRGAWPLPLPQFDINASCQAAGGDVNRCVLAERAARSWLAGHSTTVQIAGDCSAFAQASYVMIQACVQQREGAAR